MVSIGNAWDLTSMDVAVLSEVSQCDPKLGHVIGDVWPASFSAITKRNATSGNTCADRPAFPAPVDQWAMRTGTVMLDSKVRLAPPRITSCSREWP